MKTMRETRTMCKKMTIVLTMIFSISKVLTS
jgi:hypothetical protein